MRNILAAVIAVLAMTPCMRSSAADAELGAYAELLPTKGSTVKGTIVFDRLGANAMLVRARVAGLTPGTHGFHIHEYGDCSGDDALSAGGHFNPFKAQHGGWMTSDRHAGDLPVLEADASGNAVLAVQLDLISLEGGPGDIVGKSVVVHQDPDDYKTQPAGGSGNRVACGVIRRP